MATAQELLLRIKGDSTSAQKAVKDLNSGTGKLKSGVEGLTTTWMAAAAGTAAVTAAVISSVKAYACLRRRQPNGIKIFS